MKQWFPDAAGVTDPKNVSADELKPHRGLVPAQLGASWLLHALVDLEDVARSQRVVEIKSHLWRCSARPAFCACLDVPEADARCPPPPPT